MLLICGMAAELKDQDLIFMAADRDGANTFLAAIDLGSPIYQDEDDYTETN